MQLLEAIHPRRWLSPELPVDRGSYLATGMLLMGLKYALDAGYVALATGHVWPLTAFLSPFAKTRAEALGSDDLLIVLGALSLPFLAIGLSMSIRRAADAGVSPWLGLAFAVPGLNYLTIAALAVLPSRPKPVPTQYEANPSPTGRALWVATLAVAAVAMFGLGVVFIASDQFGLYGINIFLTTPVAMGALAGFLLNRQVDRGLAKTVATALVAAAVTAGSLLLFAIEGIICIIMATPLAVIAILIGAIAGRALARTDAKRSRGLGPAVVLLVSLPVLAGIEDQIHEPHTYEVRTAVEINAPPEVVWQHVLSFPEIPEPAEWYFHTGIAVPLRAHIDGHGVGAVRHCEFSTGAFVEPITAWEPGRRLAFDVTEQPPPMQEWSPYRHLHPPHLDASLRSVRGEFRLIPTATGTRLEGSTWYQVNLGPEMYFQAWSEALIHKIHLRVLDHIRSLAEAPQT